MKIYEIAVVPGDGIGKEVVPEGLNVLEAVGSAFGIGFHFRHFDWSCETYKKTGRMMPEDGIDRGHCECPSRVQQINPSR